MLVSVGKRSGDFTDVQPEKRYGLCLIEITLLGFSGLFCMKTQTKVLFFEMFS